MEVGLISNTSAFRFDKAIFESILSFLHATSHLCVRFFFEVQPESE